MPLLLFMVGAVALFFFVMALFVLRSGNRAWIRLAISIPCVLLGLLALGTFGGLAWAHYSPPPAEIFLRQLQGCSAEKDRAAVHGQLKQLGFAPILYEKPFAPDPGFPAIAASDAARSTSYIALRTERVRPKDLFAEYLDVVYLFDAHRQLITWSYQTASPSL